MTHNSSSACRDLSLQRGSKAPLPEPFWRKLRNDVGGDLRRNDFWMHSAGHHRLPRKLAEPNYGCAYRRAFFVLVALNEMPNRIETLRIRSGVRFMIRATSSSLGLT